MAIQKYYRNFAPANLHLWDVSFCGGWTDILFCIDIKVAPDTNQGYLFMKKTLLCLTLVIAFACKSFAYDFESGGLYYNIIGNGEVEVTRSDDTYYSGSIVIPSSVTYNSTTYSVTSIGDSAFLDLYACYTGYGMITSITIPNSVTSIGDYAFKYCSSLTSITIPNSVTFIGNNAFQYCTGLASISIDANNTIYDSRNNCNAIIETATNILILGCQTTVIPNSVTSIGDYAFEGCSGLTEIICHAPTPPTIESNTFSSYDNIILYVPTNSVTLYQSTVYWKNFYILPMSEEPTQLEYNLADRNVVYCNNIVYNEDGLDIRLFDTSGRMIASGNGNIDMSDCPNGIYIVTDGKGGFLKINHYR